MKKKIGMIVLVCVALTAVMITSSCTGIENFSSDYPTKPSDSKVSTTQMDASKSENISEYQLLFAKLPSPPQCKRTTDRQEVENIVQLINNVKKESIANPNENGWEIMIVVTTPTQSQTIYLLGEKLNIGGQYYKVNVDLKEELIEEYERLRIPEQPY